MSANGDAMTDAPTETMDKGKGKSVEQPSHNMGMEDDDEESGTAVLRSNLKLKVYSSPSTLARLPNTYLRNPTSFLDSNPIFVLPKLTSAEEEDEDMDEIDPSNIISSKTRNKHIDWAEAEQKSKDAGDDLDDEDEDDDEDFQGEAEDEDEEMKG